MVGEAPRSSGTDPLDGLALRQRLIETIRDDQSGYAALKDWLVRTLPAGEKPRLRERLDRPVGGAVSRHETRKQVWSETTLRKHLRQQMAERSVELDDPRIMAALDLADPLTVRTALHLGLDLAESREYDDGLFDDGYREAPTLVGVVPAFVRHGRLGEVIDAARDLTGPYRRAEALAAAMWHLPQEDRAAIAVEALTSVITACHSTSPRMWWKRLEVLELLAPQLDEAGMGQLAAELRGLARRTDDGVPPGDARLAIVIESQLLLLVHASPPAAAEVAVDGLRSAARLRSAGVSAAVIDAFAPLLPVTALEAAAATGRRLPSERRASAFARVARRADELGAGEQASDLIEEIARLPDLLAEPNIAAVVGRHANLLNPKARSGLWCPQPGEGLLHTRDGTPRDGLIRALEELSPLLTLLGGPQAPAAVGKARDDIIRWWP